MSFKVADIPYSFKVVHKQSQHATYVRKESVAKNLRLDPPKEDKFSDLLILQGTHALTAPRRIESFNHNNTADFDAIMLPKRGQNFPENAVFGSLSDAKSPDSLMLTADLKNTYKKQKDIVERLNLKINSPELSRDTLSNTDELIYIENASFIENQGDKEAANKFIISAKQEMRPGEVLGVQAPKRSGQQVLQKQENGVSQQSKMIANTFDYSVNRNVSYGGGDQQAIRESVSTKQFNETKKYFSGTINQNPDPSLEHQLTRKLCQDEFTNLHNPSKCKALPFTQARRGNRTNSFATISSQQDIIGVRQTSFNQTQKKHFNESIRLNTQNQGDQSFTKKLCQEEFTTLNNPNNTKVIPFTIQQQPNIQTQKSISSMKHSIVLDQIMKPYQISPKQKMINSRIQQIENKLNLSRTSNHTFNEQKVKELKNSIFNDIQQHKQKYVQGQKAHSFKARKFDYYEPNQIITSKLLIDDQPAVQLRLKKQTNKRDFNAKMIESQQTEYLEGSIAQLMASQHNNWFEFI
ncbi:hypothetical protein SS50377_21537 [Spironucleus salmonicida]|uniref:Uncharacterized protein n=1 Tax=Spironucleus salmonicida TaxID=348837 RepID=V6LLH6_9EUKA|nr:hypothetical protein SS50377_21537 [Spironucleus salmonicida]|eukprot:EST45515.1 Hypothetical protein SS50377_14587 [Spironucleus salmonicida]